MRRGGRAGVCGLVLLLAFAGTSPLHADTAIVLSQGGEQLTAVDVATRQVHRSLQLDKNPANLAVSADGKTAYVAHPDLSRIAVVDLAAWKISGTLPAPGAPFGMAATADRLFVADWTGESVQAIELSSGKQLASTAIGKAPAHLALTPDGTTLLAVARESDAVALLDAGDLSVRASVKVDRAPFALAVSHDGKKAVVANAQGGSYSEIDVATGRLTRTARVGAMPYGVAFTPDGSRVLITNQQSGMLALRDLAPAGEAKAAASARVGNYPEGVALARDGSTAFVANWFSDDVSVVDIAAGKEIVRIKLPKGPRMVAIVPGDVGR